MRIIKAQKLLLSKLSMDTQRKVSNQLKAVLNTNLEFTSVTDIYNPNSLSRDAGINNR